MSTAPNESAEAPLCHWLAQGQVWLADMQAAGLVGAGAPLLAAGRAWADQAALLGWSALARQMDGVLDPQLPPMERAAALLDIAVWVMTAQRLQAGADQSLP
ncbi:hypothetical protein [Delftia lacustris]|uniref:hypothetical protein n=1 Tax=Delftia lacustris TaxID=558537 RepID=UPI0035A6D3AD